MQSGAALQTIKILAVQGRMRIHPHARGRMAQRGALFEDVRAALVSASRCRPSEDGPGRWRVEGGRDRDGDDMTLVVVFEDNLLVITLF